MKMLELSDKIETQRLVIEMPKIQEAKEIYDLIDEDITQYMIWDKPADYHDTEIHLKECIEDCKGGKSWGGVIKLKDGKIIGRFGIHNDSEKIKSVHLGYWIAKPYWGKGYVPECVEAVKKIGFETLGYNRIVITCTKENLNSAQVAKKCGFTLDGVLRADELENGKIIDKAYYTLLRSEYKV